MGDLFVEARILDCDGDLGRQRRHRSFVIIGKESATSMFEIQYSDYLVLVHQRDSQLRACLGIGLDISWIFAYIGDENRFFMLRGIAHNSPTQRDVVFELNVFLEALRETVL